MVKPALGPSQALGGSAFLNLHLKPKPTFQVLASVLGSVHQVLCLLCSLFVLSWDSVGPLGPGAWPPSGSLLNPSFPPLPASSLR